MNLFPNINNRISHIDGLRGLAVFIILLFHLDVTFLKGGFVGVDIFFVISGFLITGIIARDMGNNKFSFAEFYARRIKRIFPALFVMLFAASIAAVTMLGPLDYAAFFKALRFASGQVSNVLFSAQVDYFAVKNETSPLLHTWSLGVEEQFYFVWPLLLFAAHKFFGLKRIYAVLLGLFVLSLGLSEYLVRNNGLHAFYLLHSRAWELALGGIIALKIIPETTNKKFIEILSVIGFTLILIAVFCIDKQHFPGFWALIPCLGVGLIIYSAGTGIGFVHRVLSNKLLVATGLISYSLYLWHWPIIEFYKGYVGRELSINAQIAIFAASFVIAYLSYRFIEQPALRVKLKPIIIIALGIFTAILFIVASNIIKKSDTAPWRVTYKLDAVETEPNNLFKTCASPDGVMNTNECIIGDNKNAYEVILTGDSHASHYTPAVLKWAKSNGYTVRLMLRGACQAWVESEKPPIRDGMVDTNCIDTGKEFYQTLAEQKNVKFVFLSLKLPKYNPEIRASLKKIARFNKEVVFLGSAPVFAHNPHDCMVKNHLLISTIFPKDTTQNKCQEFDAEYNNAQLAPTLNEFVPILKPLNIRYFDPRPFMPTAFDAQGHFLYMDEDHLNQYGGENLGMPLIEFMTQ